MTELQTQGSNGQPTADPTQPDDPAEPRAEKTLDSAAATADAATKTVQTGLAATAGVLQEWADNLVGLPFAVLSRGNVGPIMSGRIWLDGSFELVDVWWTVHRRSVEQLLALQRQTAVQMLDSGWALADLSRTLTRRPRPDEPRTAASTASDPGGASSG